MIVPGIGHVDHDLDDLEIGGDGLFEAGRDGVVRILSPADRSVEFVVYEEKTLAYVRSRMGYPAIYPLRPARFEGPADVVLMDLDGTSVHSERFWVWVIERTTARLLGDDAFRLDADDEVHVSGRSVSEHLQHCIERYCPDRTVEEARRVYHEITRTEMAAILEGRGKADAFTPAPGLKEFLLELKGHGVQIGLVTSGLYEKAWPEIASAFRTMGMGDPLEFYDCIITAGYPLKPGQTGTLGELSPKPHPWLYAETARVGLGVEPSRRHKVIGLEDSCAGVIALRLAGFAAIGIGGGNIAAGGVRPLLHAECPTLADALPFVLGAR